jgi:hypothetical protein
LVIIISPISHDRQRPRSYCGSKRGIYRGDRHASQVSEAVVEEPIRPAGNAETYPALPPGSLPIGRRLALVGVDYTGDWNIKAGNIVVAAKPSPGAPYRTMAIVQSAVYEAVNAITRRYPPDRVKLDAAPGASVEAAVAAANRGTLSKLAPSQQATIDDASRAALSSIPDGLAKTEGIAVGERAATAILSFCADDGADAPERYRPHTTAGVYVPTVIPVLSHWPQAVDND